MLRSTFPFLLLLMVAAVPAPAQLVRDWHVVRTTHFEIVSRYDPAIVGPVAADLEWASGVFEKNLGLKTPGGRQVLIVIPDAPYDFERMSPLKSIAGFYKQAPWRDLIAARDFVDLRHVLMHEFTHLVLHRDAAGWPAWYDEGTAELYAEMRRTEKGPEIGRAEPKRIAVLNQGAWLPVSYVTGIGHTRELTSGNALARFYAQAALYVQMLRLSPGYREGFRRFQALMAEGVAAEEALKKVYAKSLAQFDEEAGLWHKQRRNAVDLLEKSGSPEAEVNVEAIPDFDVALAKASVAGAGTATLTPEAGYKRLAGAAGEDCKYQAALGDVAYASRLIPEAALRYQRAVQCGADVATLAQGLEAALVRREGASGSAPARDLEPIAALTGTERSKYLLGAAMFFEENWEGALKTLPQAAGLPAEQGFRVTRFRALALVKVGRYGEARAEGEKLLKLARNEEQRASAELTLADLERAKTGAESGQVAFHEVQLAKLTRLEGEVVRVDCMEGRARFWVRAGAATRKLLIDPGDIITGGEDAPQLEFACGEQKRGVTIGYTAAPDAGTETEGRIKYIRFR